MRRSARLAGKRTNSENEVQMEPKAKKSRTHDKIPNIAAMDNGTMVESFKFLNYCQLATNSFVSKRFWNLIRTHRHKLALLDVERIYMSNYAADQDPADIQMFNEELSPEDYNKWIVRNGYSKQVPLEAHIDGKESAENGHNIYEFAANVYKGPNNCHDISTAVFYAEVELKDENWPLFQHFFRLLMDPFIYIRKLELNPEKDFSSLLAGGMNRWKVINRLQCGQLNIDFYDDTHKLINWIKDHVRCDKMLLDTFFGSNYHEVFLGLFLTGSPCTSEINVLDYDLSNVIVGLVQKFMDLKSCDEYQVVKSIRGDHKQRKVVKELKRDCAGFIAKEEQFEEESGTRQVIEFINNDIEKKLTFSVKNFSYVVFFN